MNRIQYRDFDPDYDPVPSPFVVQAEYCSLIGRAGLEIALAEPFRPFEFSVDPGLSVCWAGPIHRFRIFDARAIGLHDDEISLFENEDHYSPPEEEEEENVTVATVASWWFPAVTVVDIKLAPADATPKYAGQWVVILS